MLLLVNTLPFLQLGHRMRNKEVRKNGFLSGDMKIFSQSY